jgi:hypothetical protein
MFRALLAHPQEALKKRHLVYCVRIMSVGCDTVTVKLQPCHSTATDIIRVACSVTVIVKHNDTISTVLLTFRRKCSGNYRL